MINTHFLKCWPKEFKAICDDRKTFEIRKADRDYKVGDFLVLCEYDLDTKAFSGKRLCVKITYIVQNGEWNISKELCIIGIRHSYHMSTCQMFDQNPHE